MRRYRFRHILFNLSKISSLIDFKEWTLCYDFSAPIVFCIDGTALSIIFIVTEVAQLFNVLKIVTLR